MSEFLYSTILSISVWNQDKYPPLPAPSSDTLHHLWRLPSQLYFARIATASATTDCPRKISWIPPQPPAQLKLAAIYCQTIHSSALSHRFKCGSSARCQPLLMTSVKSTRFTTLPQVIRFLRKYLPKWFCQFAWSVHTSQLPHTVTCPHPQVDFLSDFTKQYSPLAKLN